MIIIYVSYDNDDYSSSSDTYIYYIIYTTNK